MSNTFCFSALWYLITLTFTRKFLKNRMHIPEHDERLALWGVYAVLDTVFN